MSSVEEEGEEKEEAKEKPEKVVKVVDPEKRRLLSLREKVKKKTPVFRRCESWRYKRVDTGWRRPKGLDNKMRYELKGWPKSVKVGYRKPKKVRNLHARGLEEVLIFSPSEVVSVDPYTQMIRIGGSVGLKKGREILKVAEKFGIHVLNPKAEALAPEIEFEEEFAKEEEEEIEKEWEEELGKLEELEEEEEKEEEEVEEEEEREKEFEEEIEKLEELEEELEEEVLEAEEELEEEILEVEKELEEEEKEEEEEVEEEWEKEFAELVKEGEEKD